MYQRDEELIHYGIPGMRWGKRKALPTSDLRSRYDQARANKRAMNKQYNRDYEKANLYSSTHFISQFGNGKNAKKSNANWAKAFKSARAADKAKSEFKKIKKERKEAIKKQYDEVSKNSKLGEKLFYNNATRKAAAKYMVDNNMTMEEAKKKAKKKAIRNTGAILGGLAAYGGYQYLKNR